MKPDVEAIFETLLAEHYGYGPASNLTARILDTARRQAALPPEARSHLEPLEDLPSASEAPSTFPGDASSVVTTISKSLPATNGHRAPASAGAARSGGHAGKGSTAAMGTASAAPADTTSLARDRASRDNTFGMWLLIVAASLLVGLLGFSVSRPQPIALEGASPSSSGGSTTTGDSADPLGKRLPWSTPFLPSARDPQSPQRSGSGMHSAGETVAVPVSTLTQIPLASPEATRVDPTADSLFASNTKPTARPGLADGLPPSAASDDASIIASINHELRRRWTEEKLKPSPFASEGEWCRRVFLDLLGRIPTIVELDRFLSDRRPSKRAELVYLLTESDEYLDQYARNAATNWANLLIGRSGGTLADRGVDREGLLKWLRDNIVRNTPYDKFARQLIAGEGTGTPRSEGYLGAVNFLLDNVQEGHVPATNKTAQLFLGMRVGCMQCHNHPFNDWKQEQFWGLNAFFKQAAAVPLAGAREGTIMQLVDRDYVGSSGDPEDAEVYYETRLGLLKVAYPTFIDGTKIGPSGLLAEVNRRDRLAELMVASPEFALAQVNRVWGQFLGYGFCMPIDDMGPHNPPSHPELFRQLARDFVTSGFDTRRLIRWIVLSDAYALSSRMLPENARDNPDIGETPQFSHFYVRQMRPEELFESLLTATQVDKIIAADRDAREKRRHDWLQQFVIAFGTDENDETTTFNGTIPQALMMMNGELMIQATNIEPGGFLYQVATAATTDRQKIQHLYLAALARKPTTAEVQMAQQLWIARQGDTAAALQDVWWALLNCNEFIMNH